jgi:hypothetical protein
MKYDFGTFSESREHYKLIAMSLHFPSTFLLMKWNIKKKKKVSYHKSHEQKSFYLKYTHESNLKVKSATVGVYAIVD